MLEQKIKFIINKLKQRQKWPNPDAVDKAWNNDLVHWLGICLGQSERKQPF